MTDDNSGLTIHLWAGVQGRMACGRPDAGSLVATYLPEYTTCGHCQRTKAFKRSVPAPICMRSELSRKQLGRLWTGKAGRHGL